MDRRVFLGGVVATIGTGLTARSARASGSPAIASAEPPPLPDGLLADAVPSEQQIYSWIETVFAQGIRRPGYRADEWTMQFCAELFRDWGLDNVRLEPITVSRWEPLAWSLEVTAGGETRTLDCYPMPFSAPVEGLEVELAPFTGDDPGAVSGKVSLLDNRLLRLPPTVLAGGGDAPDDLTGRIIDPENSFDGDEHVVPFSSSFQNVLTPSADAGAVAVIGALLEYPGDSYEYFVPYDAGRYDIPGVWIRGSDGTWLHEQLAAGPVVVRLSVTSTREEVASANLVGELPGADDETVIVGSHHDGPWASAVEDGSGISLVLAQASFWSRQRAERRPHRLVFLLNGGHMSGGAGLHAFVEEHATELDRVVLEVHLEHACLDFVEHDGELESTGQCVPRWWFTSRIPALETAVTDALTTEQLHRSMIMAPNAIGEIPPTDGNAFFAAGVPAVDFLSAPFYLFDSIDTLDKIDREHLVPLTRATIRIVDSTRGVSASDMRAAEL